MTYPLFRTLPALFAGAGSLAPGAPVSQLRKILRAGVEFSMHHFFV